MSVPARRLSGPGAFQPGPHGRRPGAGREALGRCPERRGVPTPAVDAPTGATKLHEETPLTRGVLATGFALFVTLILVFSMLAWFSAQNPPNIPSARDSGQTPPARTVGCCKPVP